MFIGNLPPVTYSYSGKNKTDIYSNPEYIRLMMTQASSNYDFATPGNVQNTSSSNNLFGGAQDTSFYSDLMKASASSTNSISPQMTLGIYSNMIGKTVTGILGSTSVRGRVESVFLQADKVIINIGGATYFADELRISKVE